LEDRAPRRGGADGRGDGPGTGEQPRAPVYIDGEKVRTLEGPTLADDFIAMVDEYVDRRFPIAAAPHTADEGQPA
jgi:hypothetical protein